MKKFGALSQRIEDAEKAMIEALEEAFPEGTKVSFYIMHGQRSPSSGVVIGHSGGRYAYLRVRMESRKKIVRDVPAGNVAVIGRRSEGTAK